MIKLLKYITIFFCLALFNLTDWFESQIADITEVKYSWYLNNDTEIQIIWTNFENCESFKINDEWFNVESIENEKIVYKFSENNAVKWHIAFICNWEYVSSNFRFPYISWFNLNQIESKGTIAIEWSNFTSWTSVNFESWEKMWIENITTNLITATLPDSLIDWNIFIISDWLKSNIFDLDIKFPYIDYAYTEKWFNIWDTIYIHWKNLNAYWKTEIIIWEAKIKRFDINEKWEIFFKIPFVYWLNDLSIISNWLI